MAVFPCDLVCADGHATNGATNSRADLDARLALQPAEVEMLRFLAQGLTTSATAARMQLPFRAAACRHYRILRTLGVSNTVGAVEYAIQAGLVEL